MSTHDIEAFAQDGRLAEAIAWEKREKTRVEIEILARLEQDYAAMVQLAEAEGAGPLTLALLHRQHEQASDMLAMLAKLGR